MSDEINLKEYVDVVQRRWKIVAIVAVGLAIVSFFYSIQQTPVYEANTTILIRGGGNPLSKFSDLAAAVGARVGPENQIIGDLVGVLQSRAVAARVVEELDLRQKIRGWDDPRMKDTALATSVQGMLQKAKSNGNLLEIKVQYSDPKLTAEIVDGFTNALSFYWNSLNQTEIQKKREYIEAQMPRVNKELATAERKIKAFTLLGVPQPTVEYNRLKREYEVKNSIYTMLHQEYETVKLEESKEIPPFSVVDVALVPKSPVKPLVKMNTMVGLILGICMGMFVAFMQEYWSGLDEDS
ncbi:MAG: Wzz/FepE/Etk N-terminal domain-containing protein [Candidatus Margulisiibacteriota bacterium]|nr:Wzz/FepE/Etk N-terminal domain-containing protein [Candidatus Margulisiibacteriota bacterium]